MAVCSKCGKRAVSGFAVSFSKRHTKRLFRPNLQAVRVEQNGKMVNTIYCTRCIKALNKTN